MYGVCACALERERETETQTKIRNKDLIIGPTLEKS